MLLEIINLVKTGTYGGKVYQATLANAGLVIEFNPNFKLSDNVKKAAEDAIEGIKCGTIKLQNIRSIRYKNPLTAPFLSLTNSHPFSTIPFWTACRPNLLRRRPTYMTARWN